MKSVFIASIFAFILFSTLPAFYVLSTTTEPTPITLQNQKIMYDMPYPGLLPDHPLYFFKIARDRVTEFLTRDNIKKAELYLNYSDKRVAMAVQLAEKGKHKQALSTLSKGEKYFEKIPGLLNESEKQGSAAPTDLVLKLKLSNQKHLEIIENMLQSFPQGEKETFQDILRINSDINKELQKM